MLKFVRHFFSDIKTDLFHSSLLLSGSLVAQLIVFAAYPVLTRLYSPGQFGEFSVFLSIAGILAILATGRFEYALMLPEDENEAKVLKKIGLWWCFLFSAGCFLASFGLGWLKNLKIPGLHFLGLYVFLIGSVQIFTLYRNRLKQYKKLAQVSVLQNTATSGSKILLGFSGALGHGLIWGSIFGQLASFMAVSKGLFEKALFTKPENYKPILQKYSAFPKYRMVQALVNSISTNLPIFFITFYFTAKEAGYFALILGIGYKIITLVSSSLYQVLYRRFTEEKNLHRPVLPLFGKIILILAVVSIVPGIPVFFLSKSLITLFFGPVWIEAAVYMRIMMPWLVLVFMVSPFAFIPDVFSFQKKVLVFDTIHLLIRILGLYTGLLLKNVYLSVILFSTTSIAYLIFQTIWYYFILQQSKNSLK
jgi:O-antigen/teichoic acid export membrane protein